MIAIGIGANGKVVEDDLVAAINGIRHEAEGGDVVATFDTAPFAHLLAAAASSRFCKYQPLPLEVLRERNAECVTQSERTLSLFGVASIAEAAALAAAGPRSQLIMPRRIIGNATVAAARSVDAREILP